MKREDLELMAPVGSRESLAAALQARADSIYFGVGRLNMRAHSADTFTVDDLHEIVATCRQHGVKSYLTLNTIIYGDDLPAMRDILHDAHDAGISAIIASDVAAMTYARKLGLEVHLSTQLNISNAEALRFYAQFADVAVLARELNLQQVRAIADTIAREHICGPSGQPVRIEMFCHGALCMAVSGKCYLSLHNARRSANRGECMQLCRRSYIVRDAETDTELQVDGPRIMSPKDLKTIRFLDRMVDAGVRVFKIEGRARGPEYVRTVVECYREAIETLVKQGQNSEQIQAQTQPPLPSPLKGGSGHLREQSSSLIHSTSPLEGGREGGPGGLGFDPVLSLPPSLCDRWDQRLATVFNRGFWDGYYLGQHLGEWSEGYGSQATERKVYVGRGTKYYTRLGLGEFRIEAAELHVGDRYLITGPTTGALYGTISEMHDDTNAPTPVARQGTHVAFRVDAKVRPSDKLYRIDNQQPNTHNIPQS